MTPLIIKNIKDRTGIDIQIGKVYFNLIRTGVDIYNVNARVPSYGEIKADRISAGISIIKLLFGEIYIKYFYIESPVLVLVIPEKIEDKDGKGEGKTVPPPLLIKNLKIRDGSIELHSKDLALFVENYSLDLNADLKHLKFYTGLNLRGLRAVVKKQGFYISSIEGNLRFEKGDLKILGLKVESEGNQVSLSGDVKSALLEKERVLGIKIDGNLKASSFRKYIPDFPKMRGDIGFAMNIKGRLDDIKYSGMINYSSSGLMDFSFGDIKSDFSGDLKELNFTNTEIRIAHGRILADGKVTLGRTPGMKVRASLEGISFAELLDNLTVHNSHVDSMLSGTATLEGLFSPFKLTGNADIVFNNFRIMKKAYTAKENRDVFLIRADARVLTPILIDDKKVELNLAKVYAGESRITAGVHLGFDNRMRIDYESDHFELPLVFPIAEFNMKGLAKLAGVVEGEYSNPVIRGNVNISDAGMMFFNLGNVNGEIEFYDMVLSFKNMAIFTDKMSVSGEGQIDFRNQVSMNLNSEIEYAELGGLLWLLGLSSDASENFSGGTTGVIKLNGAVESLAGEIKLDIDSPSVFGIEFGSGQADIKLSNNKVMVNEFTLKGSPQFIYATGTGDYKKNWVEGEFILSNLPLQGIKNLEGLPVLGFLNTRGEVSFSEDGFSGRISILLDGTNFAESRIPDSTIDITLKGWEMDLKGSILGSAEVSSRVKLKVPYEYSFKIDINELDIKPFVKHYLTISQPTGSISGKLTSRGNLSELEKSLTEVVITSIAVGEKNLYFVNDSPIEVYYNAGQLLIPEFQLSGDNLKLKFAGERDIKGFNNFTLKGDVSLALLNGIFDFLTVGMGSAGVKIRISGPDNELKTYGYLNIYDGTLAFKNFPVIFENIETEITIYENMLIIDGFYARCGGGDIGIYGGITLSGFYPLRYNLTGNIFDVRLPTLLFGTDEELPGKVSGFIQFTGTGDSPLLSGKLKVNEASYTSNVNWQTKLLKIKTRKLMSKGMRSEGVKLSMKIDIEIPDSITVKNNLADLRIGGNLSILGTIPNIYILGDLQLNKGKIYFQSEEFSLTSGLFSFKDPTGISPYFDISGVTEKEDESGQKYRIMLNISGTIEDTKVSFTSDPPLSEKDILSLLRYGVTSGKLELVGATSSEMYSFGGQVLIGELMKKEELRDILSSGIIDKIELHPYTSERGRTTTLLTLSKTFKDRFRLRYSTDVGGATQFMWASTEYSFGKYVSVIGTWDNEVLDNTTNKVGNLGIDFSIHYEF